MAQLDPFPLSYRSKCRTMIRESASPEIRTLVLRSPWTNCCELPEWPWAGDRLQQGLAYRDSRPGLGCRVFVPLSACSVAGASHERVLGHSMLYPPPQILTRGRHSCTSYMLQRCLSKASLKHSTCTSNRAHNFVLPPKSSEGLNVALRGELHIWSMSRTY